MRLALGMAAGVAAAMVPVAAARAADDGTYRIREAGSNQCVAPGEGLMGARMMTCASNTVWTMRTLADGTVRFAEPGGAGRCLGLSPVSIAPAALWLSACGTSPDAWTVDGPAGPGPLTLRLAAVPLAALAPVGNRAALTTDGPQTWMLQKAG